MSSSKRSRLTPSGVSGGTFSSDYGASSSSVFTPLTSKDEMNPRGEVTIHNNRKQWKRTINGVPVEFPGKPYLPQIRMMEVVIEGLQGKGNNLIESPTGSGKTLALLCAVLAWVKHTGFSGKIYYTTRTHSQISGVIKELKKTVYKNILTTVLGSRKQMCIHHDKPLPSESKLSVDTFCQRLRVKNRNSEVSESKSDSGSRMRKATPKKKLKKSNPRQTCEFYDELQNMEKEEKDKIIFATNVMDVEEFKQQGKDCGTCPYYTAMFRHETAQLIFCPYNYIISKQLRKSCQIHLENSLVIFDEGHNIEKACCDEASYSIKWNSINSIKESLSFSSNSTDTPETVKEELEIVETFLTSLESYIGSNCNKRNKTPGRILRDLEELDLGLRSIKECDKSLRNIGKYEGNHKTVYLDSGLFWKVCKLLNVLKILYSHCEGDTTNEYDTTNLRDYQLSFSSGQNGNMGLEVLCMNPSVIFAEIARLTTSVTITSGTLSPLSSFPRELGVTFVDPISLDQAIPRDRYIVATVGVGPTNEQLEITFRNRGKAEVMTEIGKAVLRICKVVPNGVCLFVPSAVYLNQLLAHWTATGIMDQIRKYKHVFNEADKSIRNLEAKYKEKSRNPGSGTQTGALLMAYFRGTMSEGVDFKDEEARAVITLGIPLQPFSGPNATARQEYYRHIPDGFDEWYYTDAFRAFNQAIGRCVRHLEDWGAVIMIEQRLSQSHAMDVFERGTARYDKYLPKWIKNAKQNYADEGSFQDMLKSLKHFVRRMTRRNETRRVEDSGYVEQEESSESAAETNSENESESLDESGENNNQEDLDEEEDELGEEEDELGEEEDELGEEEDELGEEEEESDNVSGEDENEEDSEGNDSTSEEEQIVRVPKRKIRQKN